MFSSAHQCDFNLTACLYIEVGSSLVSIQYSQWAWTPHRAYSQVCRESRQTLSGDRRRKLKNNFELSVFFRHAEKEESKPVVRVLGCVVVVCWLPLCSLVVQVCVLCKSLFYWETNSCNMSKPTFKGQFKRSQVRGRCLLKHIHSLLPGSGLKDKETWSHLAHPALLSLTASYLELILRLHTLWSHQRFI